MNRQTPKNKRYCFRKTGILLILVILFLSPLCGRAEAVGLDRLEIPEEPEKVEFVWPLWRWILSLFGL